MNIKKVASVSVLKPVDDIRALGKIADSLAQTNKYEINIIGFVAKKTDHLPNIHYHPIFDFPRLHPARLLAPFAVFRLLRAIRPDIVIVHTHELLVAVCLYKRLYGAKTVYDVQENYYRNIRFTTTYPALIRLPLALIVRSWEKVCAPAIDHFLLAESSYARDLSFVGNRYTIIENKTTLQPVEKRAVPDKDTMVFLYSGTISVNYGIFDALAFYHIMRKAAPARLIIAGHCAKRSTLRRLQEAIADDPHITLIGGAEPVPHEDIVDAMRQAHFALLPYHLDRSIIRCIPTKIYECIALRLPMIIRTNPLWLKLCNQYQACITSGFTNADPDFAHLLRHKKFYTKGDYSAIGWHTEKAKLADLFDSL
jgi:hypothetical protein